MEQALTRRAGNVGLLRFAAFFAALLGIGAAVDGHEPVKLLYALGGLGAAAFIGLVLHHGSLLFRRDRARLLAECNRTGLRRLDGTWTAASYAVPPPPSPPPYAEDLDLYGEASLAALIDTTQTRYGAAALASSLARAGRPLGADQLQGLQQAVRELVPLLDFRQSLEVAGRAMHAPKLAGEPRRTSAVAAKKTTAPERGGEPDPEPLLRWAEGPTVLLHLPLCRALRFLPLVTMSVLGAALVLPAARQLLFLLYVLLGIHVLALLFAGPRAARLFARVSSSEAALSAYGEMLNLAAAAPLAQPENRRLLELLRGQKGVTPEKALASLRGTYGMLELRQNLFMWVPLNLFLLWDLFFALQLERWQLAHGPRLRGWLEALGELEARAGLANLGHDNPDWAWPELFDADADAASAADKTATSKKESPFLLAEALAHPLLPGQRRVGNDVALRGPGHALLVTGSNMSGKSTLLRAIGLLQVLAQAGAPVCARRCRLCVMTLRTVVRVDDSLARGLSHFYAELRRLKEVVDTASIASKGRVPLLYLLDEILHGTNTRERELGARLTIRTLCQRGALGVVTTHDLSLTTLEQESQGAVQNAHFTEIVEDGAMRFDYRLRPGPAQSSNALRLMRACGIDLDWSLLPD